MVSQKDSDIGYLELYRKDGKPSAVYELKIGSNKIGSSLMADIRLKSKNQLLEPFVCIINVKENGLATVEKTCKEIILINGTKMSKIHMLKNNDKINVAGKVFCYVNNNLSSLEISESIKTVKRQSIMPNFKIGAALQNPVSTSRKSSLKRSFSAAKTKKELSMGSYLSSLPAKTRRSLFEWKTVTALNARRSLRPSTSMRENNICFTNTNNERKSLQSLGDSRQPSTFQKIKVSSSPRGLKRSHRSSTESSLRLSKRRRRSKDDLICLPTSDCESFHGDLDFSSESICQNSPLATTTKSQRGSLNDETNEKCAKKLLRTSVNDITGIKKQPKSSDETQKLSIDDSSVVKGIKKLSEVSKIEKSPTNDLIHIQGVDKMKISKIQKSPLNDLMLVQGIKKLMKTPKEQSPLNDLSNVEGVKKLMKTPKVKSPLNALTDLRGVRNMLRTPKQQKSPANDLRDVRGVKKLMTTPKEQKSPLNDLTNVGGVKKLMRTPKPHKSPINDLTDLRGVKQILRTSFVVQKSPYNDLTNVDGLKKLFKTPKIQKSPFNDLSDVRGVKKFMKTPKIQKSPLNDLSNICNIKNMLKTPESQKSPLNDLRDLKRILATPRIQKSPVNSLNDLKGVKKLLESPKIQKSPKDDLSNVEGVKELFSPKHPLSNTPQQVYQNLDNETAVHNTSQDPKSCKNKTCTTPNLKKNEIDEGIQLSQRGRRIRLKRFDDNFVESPKPKRGLRTRLQKTVDLSGQISVNNDDVEKSNLQEEEIKMPMRNMRGRRKNSVKEVDALNGSVHSARGGKKKNNEHADIEDTPNMNKEKKALVKCRGQKKNVVEEVLAKTSSPNMTDITKCEVQSKIVTLGKYDHNLNVAEEGPKTRSKRKKKQDEIHINNSNTEMKVEEKQNVRGQKKIQVISENEEMNNENNDIENKRCIRRGRKGKNTVELKNTSIIISKTNELAGLEESDVSEKPQERGRGKKKVPVETKFETAEVTITRSRRRVIEGIIEVPEKEKKTHRIKRRKSIEEGAKEDEPLIEGKKKRKVMNYTDNQKNVEEMVEEFKSEEISPMKTRRGRKANVQTEVKQTGQRRK